ncbi:hypothetical protein [Klebsiella pneumoniae]|uniref:hypothetical protein n=1 Tax=Klebsiella pneumoniae TaxID=573 RepID=UPI001D0D5827|nr:hypothetical protein [Klebsiella pneumoniae]
MKYVQIEHLSLPVSFPSSGLYEENNIVYSEQLTLFQKLLSGRWQKVRVTNSPFYTYLGGKDCSLVTMLDKSLPLTMPVLSLHRDQGLLSGTDAGILMH